MCVKILILNSYMTPRACAVVELVYSGVSIKLGSTEHLKLIKLITLNVNPLPILINEFVHSVGTQINVLTVPDQHRLIGVKMF